MISLSSKLASATIQESGLEWSRKLFLHCNGDGQLGEIPTIREGIDAPYLVFKASAIGAYGSKYQDYPGTLVFKIGTVHKAPVSSGSVEDLMSTSNQKLHQKFCVNKAWKKGSSYGIDIIETGKSYVETVVMEAPAAEHDGKCKCGASCTCTTCTCGH
ncbi:hypothetical protein RJ640_004459 [Escallonia rubra]|uniref:Uncharacterized protein n=1 Tax=Escallonia rubra TaxID=112253 RepID=A0AA88QKQ9_9ASTE|nr:hypothetical protein RJ640_004459 [Escallonia rubra]